MLSFILAAAVGCGRQKNNPASYEREATESDRTYFRSHAVYNGSFKSELTEDELIFYNAYEKHILEERSLEPIEIDVSQMKFLSYETERMYGLMKVAEFAFTYDHPEAFWFDLQDFDFIKDDSDQYIRAVVLKTEEKYEGAYNDWDKVQNGIQSAVNQIGSLRKSESRYDTIKAIHDYVCNHVSYYYDFDFKDPSHGIAPLFGGGYIGNRFICEGYALSVKLLCDKFDIPATVVIGDSHAFNYVQMDDGRYYVVDCTFDDYDPVQYTYFLIGSNSIVNTVAGEKFTDDLSHVENGNCNGINLDYGFLNYPEVSQYAYSSLELVSDGSGEDGIISGTTTFRFRAKDNAFKGKTANVYIKDQGCMGSSLFKPHLVGTCTIQENGTFEAIYDTMLEYNGYCELTVKVDDAVIFSRYVYIQNTHFEILNLDDPLLTISAPYEVKIKGYSSTDIMKCSLDVWLYKLNTYSTHLYHASFNSDGIASFTIDPKNFKEGVNTVNVVYHAVGKIKDSDGIFNAQEKSFRISHTAADSGKFRFWGDSAKSGRNVGEWADFTLKYDGIVTEKCQFSVTIDDFPATPLCQKGDKVTDFFDKDGFCNFYLDVTEQFSEKHKVTATLTKEDGSTVTASNTINVTDGYFSFEMFRINENGDHVRYDDNSLKSMSFVNIVLKNTSGIPGDQCHFYLYKNNMTFFPFTGGTFFEENKVDVWASYPDVDLGSQVMKVVFVAPDGTKVEKNLPFILQEGKKYYDYLTFLGNGNARWVSNTADFTLFFRTYREEIKALNVTVDGNPTSVQISDNAGSQFNRNGLFTFTLDFPDEQEKEHTVEAVLTKKDGTVLTAKQNIRVTNKYFEITNWPDEVPVLDKVFEVKLKHLTDTAIKVCTARQYIDGVDMGAVSFDDNGTATLGLNTTGLDSGEHWYKVIFSSDNKIVSEKVMRFRVN